MTATPDTAHRANFLTALSSASTHDAGHGTGIEFHDVYLAAWAHQRQCSPAFLDLTGRPSRTCLSTDCLTRHHERTLPHSAYYAARPEFDVCRRWAWAVPNAAALTAITDVAPHGVVEIGAGGGYWAHELGRVGVDVLAYDPHPPGGDPSRWHLGHPWAAVRHGDHTAAAQHPDRALLVCWPEPDTRWPTDAIAAYHAAGGRSVIYVGEGPGGVTADQGVLRLLGITSPGDDAAADQATAQPNVYAPTRQVMIPQWAGVHDHLTVCTRTDDEEAAEP